MHSILSTISKRVSDTIAVVRGAAQPQRTIYCTADTQPAYDDKGKLIWPGLSNGFFIAKHSDGAKTLGYNIPQPNCWFCFNVPTTFKNPFTGKAITLSVPRAALPVWNLKLRNQTEGVQEAGGRSFIDTDKL